MRRLGGTELRVSPWCLGGNPFGWTADERESFAVLDAYVEHGGNFIDTADVYPPGTEGGTSESIIGRWLRARRNRNAIVLATKVGAPRPGEEIDLSPEAVRKRADASLRRLQVDHVDLLYAHHDDEEVPLEESLGALGELVRAGKARYLAASNYTAARLAKALEVSRRDGLPSYIALQTHYNLLERDRIRGERASIAEAYEGPLAELCLGEGIGMVPYWVLAKGFLTGKYRLGDEREQGPEFSERARDHRPREYLDGQGARVLEALDEIAAAHRTGVAAVAMAWTIARPGITSALASARTGEQVAQLAAALDLELSEEEHGRLGRASESRESPSQGRATGA